MLSANQPLQESSIKDSPSPSRQGQGGGPKTPDGKRRVSRNAITHGLTCRAEVVLASDDSAEFQAFRAAMVADNQPVGAQEQNCVERMVATHWSLRHYQRAERQMFDDSRHGHHPAGPFALALLVDGYGPKVFQAIARVAAQLNREYHRCSRRLEELQAQRRKGLRHVIEEEDTAAETPTAPSASPEPLDAAPETLNTPDTATSEPVVQESGPTVTEAAPIPSDAAPDSAPEVPAQEEAAITPDTPPESQEETTAPAPAVVTPEVVTPESDSTLEKFAKQTSPAEDEDPPTPS